MRRAGRAYASLILVIVVFRAEPLARAEPGEDPLVLRRVGPLGQPLSEEVLVAGRGEGPRVTWHETGWLFETVELSSGREHGLESSYDDEGRLVAEGAWERGRPHGTWRFFHVDGQIASEGAYVDGMRQGPWIERFDDGRAFRIRTWVSGELAEEEPAALWCRDFGYEWRVDLAARTEGCLDDDVEPVGLWRGYHPDGQVAWERTWAAGLLDEEAFDYHPGGALLHQGQYRIGAPDGRHIWTAADGSPLGVYDFEGGSGPWRAFHPSGAIAEEGRWQDYRRDGSWRAWDERGRLVSEIRWERGMRLEARERRGDVTIEGRFAEGEREGAWSAWDDDGRRVWHGDYAGGARVGDWIVEDAVVTFEDDEVVALRRSWPSGAAREERLGDHWVALWPDGVVLADDALAPMSSDAEELLDALGSSAARGRVVEDDATWERALEIQAWLLADPRPTPSRLASTRDPRRHGAELALDPVEPEARPVVPSEGGTNEAGDPDGIWTYFHDDGARQEEGRFDDGQRVGRWRGWDREGHLAWEGTFVADRLDGPWRTFRREAAPRLEVLVEGRFAGGERAGTWIWYHPEGRPRTIGRYEDGLAEGTWRGLRPDGTLLWEATYRAGARVGPWRLEGATVP